MQSNCQVNLEGPLNQEELAIMLGVQPNPNSNFSIGPGTSLTMTCDELGNLFKNSSLAPSVTLTTTNHLGVLSGFQVTGDGQGLIQADPQTGIITLQPGNYLITIMSSKKLLLPISLIELNPSGNIVRGERKLPTTFNVSPASTTDYQLQSQAIRNVPLEISIVRE